MKFYLILALSTFIVVNGQVLEPFRLSNYYTNGMVLQREPKSAVIWGYGEPGAEAVVSYESNRLSTIIDGNGKWNITLLPHAASGSIDFAVQQIGTFGLVTIPFKAMFGDVWVCSGQSNMAMPLRFIFNGSEEANRTISDYQHFQLRKVTDNYTLDEGEFEETSFNYDWTSPNSDVTPNFSALCVLFVQRLSDALNASIPFGLIDTTWPGTRIEAWSSPRVIETCNAPSDNATNQNANSALWKAMVAPLTKTSVRGVLWYQGENNIDYNEDYYACHILELINDWKRSFFQGDVAAENGVAFPFGVVQNGPLFINHNYKWGDSRWHQTLDVGILPNALAPEAFTGAVYDLTDHFSPTGSIHPRDKQTVADRLANAAKKLLYNQNFSLYGPVPTNLVGDASGTWTIEYDRNIKLVGTLGFAFQLPDGSYELTDVISTTSNSVTVTVSTNATQLVYAYSSYVCEYKDCAVYSDDAENLPAQVWKWQLS
ncbi:sialate O-acetylesterase-like [Neocloeon triangulifer]|uniref:sialate O-acetylesterase-like n=1 Tax=Neocloeon triangulifer TaxID=2078957 RepID=UPI00286EEB45|nr:sialate O-acetylesterase-like [Neocloeon triangulifer]